MASNNLIINKLLIILGSICAEDFQDITDNQNVSNQRLLGGISQQERFLRLTGTGQ